jgi:hypothetical protein
MTMDAAQVADDDRTADRCRKALAFVWSIIEDEDAETMDRIEACRLWLAVHGMVDK